MSEPPVDASVAPTSTGLDLEDLFENAPIGYLVLAADGRITRVNATFTRWIGLEAQALVGRRFRDLLTTAARIFYETNFAPLLRLQGGFEEVALELATGADGTLPIFVNAVERRDLEGRPTAALVTVVRARERRGYERDLQNREADALQRLTDEQSISLLREQFIAVLGHDLRNPLAAVSSGLHLLQRGPSKEKAEQIAAMMQASVLRMSGMIENVLDFARGRLGGGISLKRRPADLETAVLQVVDELRVAYPHCRIEATCDLPPMVDCDVPRMSQMLSNLLGNACTHGDHATPIVVRSFAHDSHLEISVTNGGAPIAEAKIKVLFEPFTHEPGTAPKQGLGLGLFIASQIAKSHGGSLAVSSSESETRFTFRMPLASA